MLAIWFVGVVWKVVEACLNMACWYFEGGLEDGLNMFGGWLGGDLMMVWQWPGVCLAGGFQGYWACGLDWVFQARNQDALPNTIPTAFQQSPKQLAKPPTDNLKLPATCLQTVCKPPSKPSFKPTFKHRPNNPVPQCLPALHVYDSFSCVCF